jgi:putative ABC transport system permease protein
MGQFTQDLRYGVRMLGKSPGFTAVAVLALALGVGANTAIFSVVNTVLLRPLPFKDSGRLVLLQEGIPKLGVRAIPVCAPDVLDYERQNHVFEELGAFRTTSYDLSGLGEAERVRAARVSAGLFPLLGVQPALGRVFAREEDQPGHLVAVLSDGLWRRFGADPGVVGRTVALDRKPYTIIGVMPPRFEFPLRGPQFHSEPAELWLPMAFTPEELRVRGDNFNNSVIARLKPGVTLARANADVMAIARRIQELFPPDVRKDFNLEASVVPYREQVVGGVRTLLLVLLGAVGFVVLIACANVANLLLTRAAARQKEIAIRTALGASRLRLVCQLLSESALLALLGGALGLLLAYWGTDLLVAVIPGSIPRSQEIAVDLQVLGFTLALSLATGLVFGAGPAVAATRTRVNETLKEGGRGSAAGVHRSRLHGALIISEVALALVLLAGAGLLVRSFIHLRETDPGFRPQQVLTMSVSLAPSKYAQPEQVRAFFQRLLERLQSQPGVKAVGAGTDLPLEGSWLRAFSAEDRPEPEAGKFPVIYHTAVRGDYFEALGIPLKRGRYFSEQERPEAPCEVVLSESMARRFWPGEDPIGKRLKWGARQTETPWLAVVGVVGDVKQAALEVETQPHTYEPYWQAEHRRTWQIAVRAAMAPSALTSAVRAQVRALDPEQPVTRVRTMEQVISTSMAPRRLNMFLLVVFASAATLLAAIGIYGVMAYSVTQRTHEIGVRMALGARRGDVLRMVIRQGMTLVLIGVGIGLGGALALTRVLASFLYGVKPTDPLTFAAVSVLLAAVALLADYIPARRATRVDPMIALRYE